MDTDSFLVIIIGALLKLIDDFYDMKLFNQTIANIAQLTIVLLIIYVSVKKKEIAAFILISCIYALLADGEMEDSEGKSVMIYYLFFAIAIAVVIYHYTQTGYADVYQSMTTTEIFRVFLIGLIVYIENKQIPEDVSKLKLKTRIFLLIMSSVYIFYEEYYDNPTAIVKYIHLLLIGYAVISIGNISYALYKFPEPTIEL
jgi:hypothetical protein